MQTDRISVAGHNDLVRAIDNKHISLLVLLDLSAAFDTVDHDILLSVLEHRFAVRGTALDWFRSYLTERTQSFVFAGKQTMAYQVDCSVPQSSVLGPLSFVAYADDMIDDSAQIANQLTEMRKDISRMAQRYDSLAISAPMQHERNRPKSPVRRVSFSEPATKERPQRPATAQGGSNYSSFNRGCYVGFRNRAGDTEDVQEDYAVISRRLALLCPTLQHPICHRMSTR